MPRSRRSVAVKSHGSKKDGTPDL